MWARGSVPLPEAGRIDVSWRIGVDNVMHVQVWAPGNVELEVHLPEGYEGKTEIYWIGEKNE